MWPINASNGLIWLVIIIVVALLIWWLWPRNKGDTSAQGALKKLGDAAKDQAEGGASRTGQAASTSQAKPDVAPDVTGAASRSAAMAETTMAATGGAAMMAVGVPPAQGAPDDLRQIKGVGPKVRTLLADLGITRFDQIAAWGDPEIAKVDAHLGTFRGRVRRDHWVEQAGLLAKGDVAGFEAKFGKLNGAAKG